MSRTSQSEKKLKLPRVLGIFAAYIISLSFSLPGNAQSAPRKESPFEGLRWIEDQLQVLVDATWYTPVSIDGFDVDAILNFCENAATLVNSE